MPLDPRDARPPNSPAFSAWAQPAGWASWWAQGGAVYRCPVPRGKRSVPVPLLPAAPPAGPGHPWDAAFAPAGEESGMQAPSGTWMRDTVGLREPHPAVPCRSRLSRSPRRGCSGPCWRFLAGCFISVLISRRSRSCFGLKPDPALGERREGPEDAERDFGSVRGHGGGCDPTAFQTLLLCDFGLPRADLEAAAVAGCEMVTLLGDSRSCQRAHGVEAPAVLSASYTLCIKNISR